MNGASNLLVPIFVSLELIVYIPVRANMQRCTTTIDQGLPSTAVLGREAETPRTGANQN